LPFTRAENLQDYGQLVRVEVHGDKTPKIPNIKSIFDQVTESNVQDVLEQNKH